MWPHLFVDEWRPGAPWGGLCRRPPMPRRRGTCGGPTSHLWASPFWASRRPSRRVIHPGPSVPPGPIAMTGSVSCFMTDSMCTFEVIVYDPAIIFFRWDFDGNGTWDFPAQTGGSMGTWALDRTVTLYGPYFRRAPPILHVCAQGWDGLRAGEVGGVKVPFAATACSDSSIPGTLGIPPGLSGRTR